MRPSSRPSPSAGSSEISRWPSRSTKSHSEANCAAGGDAERALDHAAEHDDEPERARGVHHAHGLADAARLGQLEVDAVGVARHVGDVAQRVAALVDDQRDAAADRAQLAERVALAGRERLLDQLDAEPDQRRQQLARLRERPSPRWRRRAAAGRRRARMASQPLEVALAAELDLEPPVARLGGAARAVRRALDGVDADRVRRLGRAVGEAEQAPGRLADQLADQVVEGALDRAAADDRAAARAQARLDRLERERVVAERVAGAVDERAAPRRRTRRSDRRARPRRGRPARRARSRPTRPPRCRSSRARS